MVRSSSLTIIIHVSILRWRVLSYLIFEHRRVFARGMSTGILVLENASFILFLQNHTVMHYALWCLGNWCMVLAFVMLVL